MLRTLYAPTWVGEKGRVRSLLLISQQIHNEVKILLYSRHTLFFQNSFNPNRLSVLLDILSATARRRILRVGFEIFFFVHSQAEASKRTWSEYKRVTSMLREKLPQRSRVVLYLDPGFCFPPPTPGDRDRDRGRDPIARGIWYLITVREKLHNELGFWPLLSSYRDTISRE